MRTLLRPALVTVGLFTLLLGLAAPLAMTGLATALLPAQAGGSLIEREGRVVGSALVGQGFAAARYFHPRPSAAGTGYDASAGAASQLGPGSARLLEAVRARVAEAGAAPLPGGTSTPVPGGTPTSVPAGTPTPVPAGTPTSVPADAVTASGSGLDPHISPENALRQVARVAAARGMDEARLRAILARHIEAPLLGLLGMPRVNVLALNLALDAAE